MSPSNARSSRRAGFTLTELVIVMSLLAVLSLAVLSAYLFMGRNLERLAKTQQQDVQGRRALFQFTNDVGSAISFTSTTSANLTMTVPTTLTLTSCATTSGWPFVTCASTTGLVANMTLSGLGISTASTVKVAGVTNATTFVMSAGATATNTGVTLNAVGTPANVTYLYNSGATPATLTRTTTSGTMTLLNNIYTAATNPANGFVYYDISGTATTAAASTKTVEFAFTTRVGNSASGTQSTYVLVSPRVIARNKQFLP